MQSENTNHTNHWDQELQTIVKAACHKVAPVWPLESFVAVNPYMGFTDKSFSEVAAELSTVGEIEMTMPASYYLEKLAEGSIQIEDVQEVLHSKGHEIDVYDFLKQVRSNEADGQMNTEVNSVADLASSLTDTDWNRFMISRISSWAASYFDQGQATWKSTVSDGGIFKSWKAEASVDFSTSLTGLKSFRKYVSALPDDYQLATQAALTQLKIYSNGILPVYLHRLLRIMGGWSAYAAYLDWQQKLNGEEGKHLQEFLAVIVCWEACFLQSLNDQQVTKAWTDSHHQLMSLHSEMPSDKPLADRLILQEAFDLAKQKQIISKFHQAAKKEKQVSTTKKAQAVFCIDVRSEVYRRNLEQADPEIETLGFAGFFGFPIDFVSLGSNQKEAQCPVLLKPGVTVKEEIKDEALQNEALIDKKLETQLKYIWKSFKTGAVTCFSFVSPVGLSFLPKLITDTFGWSRPVPHPKNHGLNKKQQERRGVHIESSADNKYGIPFEQQVQLATNALTAMSLTDNFAPLILLVGHGSTSVNNPHATGLDCGACGGKSGEANAKVAAAVLNDYQVRVILRDRGIDIPRETIFLAGLHDTTSDEVTVFGENKVPKGSMQHFEEVKAALHKAGHLTRTARAVRMNLGSKNTDAMVKGRGNDWSQVRPEWGLAGCAAFVVGERSLTSNIDLKGESFLHSYNWKKDKEFAVLEQIMTAPMVVTSWINLQYYASSVDNKKFGSGNKTLHNVTAGIGVIEGSTGDLRQGLPWQSVHDGTKYQHEPIRLNVIIQAPTDAINGVLEKHQSVRDLCDNHWINVLTMNDSGEITHRYEGGLSWQTIAPKIEELSAVEGN